jgi:hypothetical protein
LRRRGRAHTVDAWIAWLEREACGCRGAAGSRCIFPLRRWVSLSATVLLAVLRRVL